MQVYSSAQTKLRNAHGELHGGKIIQPLESPKRVDMILAALQRSGAHGIREPRDYGLAPVLAVHDPQYLEFLAHAWDEWVQSGHQGEPVPTIVPGRNLRSSKIPADIAGKIGFYALATETCLSPGTYEAALSSKDIALSAAEYALTRQQGAFGLCRPPGHHAARDQFGGYCFFNNAAIAAQFALDRGIAKAAILDIDYHHGNGTQQIFYERSDVLFLSLHADPACEFPYYLGYADERGSGAGAGFNRNYPLAKGSSSEVWLAALEEALLRVHSFQPGLLIVSLGVDTYAGDPLGTFAIQTAEYRQIGKRIAAAQLPTAFLLEGGYAVEEIGLNVLGVLDGFDSFYA